MKICRKISNKFYIIYFVLSILLLAEAFAAITLYECDFSSETCGWNVITLDPAGYAHTDVKWLDTKNPTWSMAGQDWYNFSGKIRFGNDVRYHKIFYQSVSNQNLGDAWIFDISGSAMKAMPEPGYWPQTHNIPINEWFDFWITVDRVNDKSSFYWKSATNSGKIEDRSIPGRGAGYDFVNLYFGQNNGGIDYDDFKVQIPGDAPPEPTDTVNPGAQISANNQNPFVGNNVIVTCDAGDDTSLASLTISDSKGSPETFALSGTSYQIKKTFLVDSEGQRTFTCNVVDSASNSAIDSVTITASIVPPSLANEAEGRSAIESAVQNSLSSGYTTYNGQKVYTRMNDNTQRYGTYDVVVKKDSKVWAINYLSLGQLAVGAQSMPPAFFVLEIAEDTVTNIQQKVSDLIG